MGPAFVPVTDLSIRPPAAGHAVVIAAWTIVSTAVAACATCHREMKDATLTPVGAFPARAGQGWPSPNPRGETLRDTASIVWLRDVAAETGWFALLCASSTSATPGDTMVLDASLTVLHFPLDHTP
ncbi:MAG: hypothetical protein IT545_14590 [Rhodobacteraceae bacterium]|nr:hypothetical protein [Paracoccaceae bacterium]